MAALAGFGFWSDGTDWGRSCVTRSNPSGVLRCHSTGFTNPAAGCETSTPLAGFVLATEQVGRSCVGR